MMKTLIIKSIIIFSYITAGQLNFSIDHLVEIDDMLVRPFTNDVITGKVFKIFNNGYHRKKNVGSIINSLRHGTWNMWWENGKIMIEGRYFNGIKDGFWHEWNEEGILLTEMVYENGTVVQLKNCNLEKCDSIITRQKIIKMP